MCSQWTENIIPDAVVVVVVTFIATADVVDVVFAVVVVDDLFEASVVADVVLMIDREYLFQMLLKDQ